MENIKKFSSKGISITREDYESLPLPMYAYEFNDEQMQTLVENIANSLCAYYGYTEKDNMRLFGKSIETIEENDFDDAFWIEMEECAVTMGMRYYSDINK
jgi:hypothetical protein